DLRLLVSALHVAGDLERMGDLAEHVAKTALRRLPGAAVPAELADTLKQMGDVADRIAGKITSTLSTSDVVAAGQLDRDDDAMDDLYRQLFWVVLDKNWQHGVEPAIDAALLGRWYERYADHAVNVAGHVVFLVTGENLPN